MVSDKSIPTHFHHALVRPRGDSCRLPPLSPRNESYRVLATDYKKDKRAETTTPQHLSFVETQQAIFSRKQKAQGLCGPGAWDAITRGPAKTLVLIARNRHDRGARYLPTPVCAKLSYLQAPCGNEKCQQKETRPQHQNKKCPHIDRRINHESSTYIPIPLLLAGKQKTCPFTRKILSALYCRLSPSQCLHPQQHSATKSCSDSSDVIRGRDGAPRSSYDIIKNLISSSPVYTTGTKERPEKKKPLRRRINKLKDRQQQKL